MKRSDFQFTTKFETKANVSFGNFNKINKSGGLLAKASLDDLRQLLPDEEEIKDNPDLLYTSFNAAVINLINANDHGMATDTALAIAKYFKDRHMNIEHNRYQVIGHIMNYGFSSFGDNKIIEASSLEGSTDPFNLCLGAIVYKVVDEWIADFIEDSANPKSYNYKEISASWEIGYNEYDIVLGSKKLKDAEIILDDAKKKECDAFLRMNGGSGFMEDGTPVYALIKGSDARPLGCAFTFSPAAAVEGVVVASTEESPEFVTKQELEESIARANEGIINIISKENKEKNQQTKKNTVIKNMKINAIEDITTDFLREAEASHVTSFIREKLKETSDKFAADLQAAQDEKKQIADSLKDTEDEKKKLEDKIQGLEDKVKNLTEAIANKEKDETFNLRMGEITENYELNESQIKAIANQIRDLDEKGYDSWKVDFELFAKKAEDKSDKAKEAAAALDETEPEKVFVPSSQGGEKDEMAEVLKSFSDNLKIKTR